MPWSVGTSLAAGLGQAGEISGVDANSSGGEDIVSASLTGDDMIDRGVLAGDEKSGSEFPAEGDIATKGKGRKVIYTGEDERRCSSLGGGEGTDEVCGRGRNRVCNAAVSVRRFLNSDSGYSVEAVFCCLAEYTGEESEGC